MLKLHLTPLNIVLAATVAYGAMSLANGPFKPPVTVAGNTVTLNGEVSERSSGLIVDELTKLRDSGATKVLLDIDSPGGDVLAGREVHTLMNKDGMTVNTFSDNYFMSMGMSFFLEGSKRIITSEAIGMIHRGGVGSMSYFQLTKELEKAEQLHAHLSAAGSDTSNIETVLERLHSMKDAMDKLMARDLDILEQVKKTAPNPAKTQEIIDSLRIGNRDIFLDAKELIESGIATHLVSSKKEAEAL